MACYSTHGNQRVLNEGAFLVSKTDEKGVILFANNDFCDIAGYRVKDLVGKPHNIIRHQDMPKAAFEDLWKTIKKGEVWKGFVKNKTKDSNQYYWVYATVFPKNENGKITYISCRRKAHEDEIANAIKLYKTLK